MKPRFFGSFEAFRDAAPLDGFHLERRGGDRLVSGRFGGRGFRLELAGGGRIARYSGAGFAISFDPRRPESTAEGAAEGEVDLTYFHLMNLLQQAIFAEGGTSYVGALWPE
jgi:hypothetical protein